MPFGAMLGADGKPFKTRSGDVVKLADLLDEAEQRARELVAEKSDALPEAEQQRVASAIGIGAIKYADLSKNRTNDYVFDWEQMLSFEGNTAPYLQYACARIHSLFGRSNLTIEVADGELQPAEAAEHELAVSLARFQEVVDQVAEDGLPHYLCAYAFEVASKFSRFYEQCPVLNAEQEVRDSRLAFCAKTLAVLERSLSLLGIESVRRM